jgi:hypothetical protein
MTRWKAAGLHLSISLLIGTIAFCLLYFVYYPQPFFVAAGADVLVLILLGVDVALGPLLTLAVFKSGKWGMKFDLIVIAVLQGVALCYGLFVMWNARPVFIVAAVDRFEIVYSGQISLANFKNAEFSQFSREPKWGPLFATLRSPKPGAEQSEIMDAIFSGSDTKNFPRYFLPFTKENTKSFFERAIKINDLPIGAKIAVAQYSNSQNLRGNFAAFPIMGHNSDQTALIDADSQTLIAVLPVSAWD